MGLQSTSLNFLSTFFYHASDLPAWRSKVRSGVMEYEKEGIQNAIQNRQLRKKRACKPPSPGQQLHRGHTVRDCSQLQLDLRSHLRTHHAWSHVHLHTWRSRITFPVNFVFFHVVYLTILAGTRVNHMGVVGVSNYLGSFLAAGFNYAKINICSHSIT